MHTPTFSPDRNNRNTVYSGLLVETVCLRVGHYVSNNVSKLTLTI